MANATVDCYSEWRPNETRASSHTKTMWGGKELSAVKDSGRWTVMFLGPLSWLLLLCCLGLFTRELPGAQAGSVPSAAKTLVWGPGLEANIVLPARFFYIQAVDSSGRK